MARERKIWRKIYGRTYEKAYWRMRLNEDTLNKCITPGSVTVIPVCKLEWLGHVVRKDSERAVNQGGEKKHLN
jgi:hypothetical protein